MGILQPGTLDLCRKKVLRDTINRLNFEYKAFSDFKVDKKAKSCQNKKNSILQVGANEHNQERCLMVYSKTTNHF